MRRLLRLLPTLLLAAGALGTMVAVHAQQRKGDASDSTLSRAVFTDKEVFLPAGAEMIAGTQVIGVHPAPGGRWVLAVRMRHDLPATLSPLPAQEPPGEISLLLWDSQTRRTVTPWRQRAGAVGIETVQWLPRSERALVVAWDAVARDMGNRRSLLLVDARRYATPRALATLDEGEVLAVSPMQPLAVLWGEKTFRLVRADGSVGGALAAPEGASRTGQWSADGHQMFLQAGTQWHALNAGTGAVRALEQPPTDLHTPGDPIAALPIRLKQSTATVTEEGTAQTLRPLWLAGDARSARPRALLAPDSQGGMLLPDGSAAVYLQDGALYAVPLLRVDKAAFLAARREAQKTVTISNAKQLGLGLMMYAQDYDETFPPADDPVETLLPYIKNRVLFNNPATGEYAFTYQFNGRRLMDIEAPAETVMGYLLGPGGRAVLYADGHVKWEEEATRQ